MSWLKKLFCKEVLEVEAGINEAEYKIAECYDRLNELQSGRPTYLLKKELLTIIENYAENRKSQYYMFVIDKQSVLDIERELKKKINELIDELSKEE